MFNVKLYLQFMVSLALSFSFLSLPSQAIDSSYGDERPLKRRKLTGSSESGREDQAAGVLPSLREGLPEADTAMHGEREDGLDAQREARLAKKRERNAAYAARYRAKRKANETKDQHQERLAKARGHDARYRASLKANEIEEQPQERLAKKRVAKASLKANEIEEQPQER